MIYVARLFSVLGGFLFPIGLLTLFAMSAFEARISTFVFEYWPQSFALTFSGFILLLIGQMLGSDILKLRGKDSIIDLPHKRDGLNQYDLTGHIGFD